MKRTVAYTGSVTALFILHYTFKYDIMNLEAFLMPVFLFLLSPTLRTWQCVVAVTVNRWHCERRLEYNLFVTASMLPALRYVLLASFRRTAIGLKSRWAELAWYGSPSPAFFLLVAHRQYTLSR